MMPSPLIESIGVQWEQPVPVTALAWSADGERAGYALGDGHVVVADSRWPEGPQLVPRPEGGVLLQPATAEASQPLRVSSHPGAALCIAADAHGAFLTGGDGGHLVRVPRLGAPDIVSHQPGVWIDAVASTPHGVDAHASGKRVHRVTARQGEALALPATANALAFSPSGGTLAIAHHDGVTLWADDGSTRLLAWPGYHRALAWSPDGRYLVTGMQENALHGWRVADGGDIEMGGYPGQPLSIAFSHDGRYLATSGATRPVCWDFDPPGARQGPIECGIASRTPVTRIACHPRRSLIAAGYHNGAVLLCRPGQDDGLFVRGAGGAEVTALAWSGDGARLAFGTQGGVFGWLELPAILFRDPSDEAGKASATALTETH